MSCHASNLPGGRDPVRREAAGTAGAGPGGDLGVKPDRHPLGNQIFGDHPQQIRSSPVPGRGEVMLLVAQHADDPGRPARAASTVSTLPAAAGMPGGHVERDHVALPGLGDVAGERAGMGGKLSRPPRSGRPAWAFQHARGWLRDWRGSGPGWPSGYRAGHMNRRRVTTPRPMSPPSHGRSCRRYRSTRERHRR